MKRITGLEVMESVSVDSGFFNDVLLDQLLTVGYEPIKHMNPTLEGVEFSVFNISDKHFTVMRQDAGCYAVLRCS